MVNHLKKFTIANIAKKLNIPKSEIDLVQTDLLSDLAPKDFLGEVIGFGR